jgi:glutaryl-CoA dehydrogenase
MSTTTASKKAATDLYQSHDHYLMDELLTEEHRLIRDTARKHVSTHLKPIIEERFEKGTFSHDIIPGLAEIGAFGPMVPVEYGGMGLDQISYGLIMQEIERCDSGLRSLCSVQGSW